MGGGGCNELVFDDFFRVCRTVFGDRPGCGAGRAVFVVRAVPAAAVGRPLERAGGPRPAAEPAPAPAPGALGRRRRTANDDGAGRVPAALAFQSVARRLRRPGLRLRNVGTR